MMKEKIILAVIILTLGCSKIEVREVKDPISGQLIEQFEEIETENGSYFKNGYYKSWYSNGQIKSNGNYKNNKKDGKWTNYYKSGQIRSVLEITNDTLNGKFIKYYENGQINLEGSFVMGKENGESKEFYESGQLKSETNYTNGLKDGMSTIWHVNGQKSSQGLYSNNEKVKDSWKYWDKEGNSIKAPNKSEKKGVFEVSRY